WGNLSGMYNQRRLIDTNRLFERIEGGELFSKVMDLPTKYRMVVVLYYFEGMTTVEIAAVLSLKESTVRTRLCRAREMLKKTLAGEEYV
ncbi:MAG TPA: sigma-70 family RNA polymerase sigma factor, partial [Bacillota bacterium]|nr:sigma-70 family RNA polymerase sigma factor [Bacillota bacterium]